MALYDSLPADQKAVIQLLLKQGKSYDDLSNLLRISPEAVRERALTALDALGPEDAQDLTATRQDEIADYLLGQQGASARAATREFLEGSAGGRAWARVVSGELRPLAGDDGLPEIPAEGAEVDEAFEALSARQRNRKEREQSSKVGGLLLLVGLGLALAILLVFVIGGGDDGDKKASTTASTSTAPRTTAAEPTVEQQINLKAVTQGSKSLGVATLLTQEGQRALAVIGQNLQPSPRYVVWLYNSPSSAEFLGFAPPVEKNGRLQGLAPVTADVSKFKEVIVTRETVDRPSKPGTIVLRGPIKQG